MPTFGYRAYGERGPIEDGTIEAADVADASRQLQRARKRAFDIQPLPDGKVSAGARKRPEPGRRWNTRELAQLFQDVAALQNAGFTAFASLRIVAAASSPRSRRAQLEAAADRISDGIAFSDAFGTLPGMPGEVKPMLASGESSGKLGDVLVRLAEAFTRGAAVRTAVLDAIAYPAFLVLVAMAAVLFFALYLIPAIEPIFAHHPAGTPMAVKIFSSLGRFLKTAWPALLLVLAVVLVGSYYAARWQGFLSAAAGAAARMPFVGWMMRTAALSRYLHTLSMLLANGVTMASALKLAEETASVPLFRRAFADIREGVTRGDRLDAMCRQVGLFDNATITLIQMGEESNSLAALLGKAAALLDAGRRRRLDWALAVLSPCLTIAIGIMIGGLVLSVMTALLAINDAALQ